MSQTFINSDRIIQRAGERLAAQREARKGAQAEFAASTTFMQMVARLQQPGPRAADQEECAYFPDRVRKRLDWDFVSDEDIQQFFHLVGDVSASTVVPGSVQRDPTCPFENFKFEHFGLIVHVLIGQGSIITVMNKEAAAA